MPRGDRSGPMGMGPRTGRAAGFCTGNSTPGFMNPYGSQMGGGFGWGRGRGMGRGLGRWGTGMVPYGPVAYGPAYSPEDEMEFLRNQAKALGDQLDQIQKRISEMESESKKKTK